MKASGKGSGSVFRVLAATQVALLLCTTGFATPVSAGGAHDEAPQYDSTQSHEHDLNNGGGSWHEDFDDHHEDEEHGDTDSHSHDSHESHDDRDQHDHDHTPPPAPTPTQTGSITVCNILANSNGVVVDGATIATTIFTIAGITPDPETSQGPTSGEISASVFTMPMSLTTKILTTTTGNDAQCIVHSGLTIDEGGYYYDQEDISNSDDFLAPLYSDQTTQSVHTTDDLFSFSPELYDTDPSNDAARNQNSDGHIVLTPENPNRTLIVFNQMAPKESAPVDSGSGNGGTSSTTATSTDTGGGVGGGEDRDDDSSGGNGQGSTGDGGSSSPAPTGGNGGGGGGGTISGPLSYGYVNTGSGAPQSGGLVLGTSTESVGSTSCGPLLKTYLRLGRKNDAGETVKLQNFLNSNLGTSLKSGIFDQDTFSAVENFQTKYWEEVLKPWVPFGLPTDHTPTGYVYKTTQREINNLYCPTLTLPIPQLP